MLQDFLSVPDDFGTSCIKGLKHYMTKTYTEINKERILNQNLATAFMIKIFVLI